MTNAVSRTITDQELNAIIYIESAGVPTARARTSSAAGLFQFLKGTWRDTVKKHRPDVFRSVTDDKLLAMRTNNPSFAIEMGARFTEDNRRIVGSGSLGDLYLAHFLGAGDAKKFFRADPATPVSALVSSQVIKANMSIMSGKTAGQVRAWAASKMASAMKKAGNYVGKYYTGPLVLPVGMMDRAEIAEYVDYRPGLRADGDARLYDNQAQLKAMNYNPGGLDGIWGGGTSGAISGFLNDRGSGIAVPTSWNAYDKNYEAIDAAIDKAESEGFRRPVTKAREDAQPDTVERVAPEIVPAKRGFWASITAFFGAMGTSIYQGFNWLMGYRQEVAEFGVMSYVDKVPPFVWLLLGSTLLGFLVYTTVRTVKGIEKPVTTGARM